MSKEWTEWKGGDCPAYFAQRVQYRLRNGQEGEVGAWQLNWKHTEGRPEVDVVAWRVADAPAAPAPVDAAIGWIPWHGGECPAPTTTVDVTLRDGTREEGQPAKLYRWEHIGDGGDVVCWRPTVLAGTPVPERVDAPAILKAAAGHIGDRAVIYDAPGGERSVPAVVEAFAAVTGIRMTPEQGWLFLVLLKAVRSQQGAYKGDNYEDLAAYAALMGEAAACSR